MDFYRMPCFYEVFLRVSTISRATQGPEMPNCIQKYAIRAMLSRKSPKNIARERSEATNLRQGRPRDPHLGIFPQSGEIPRPEIRILTRHSPRFYRNLPKTLDLGPFRAPAIFLPHFNGELSSAARAFCAVRTLRILTRGGAGQREP